MKIFRCAVLTTVFLVAPPVLAQDLIANQQNIVRLQTRETLQTMDFTLDTAAVSYPDLTLTDPVVAVPDIAEPIVVTPVVSDPVEPIIEVPVVADPVVEEPVVADPVVEEPVVADPEDVAVCGDGIVAGDEECDGLAGVEPIAGEICATDCRLAMMESCSDGSEAVSGLCLVANGGLSCEADGITPQGFEGEVTDADFSVAGRILLATADDGVYALDVASGAVTQLATFAETGAVRRIAASELTVYILDDGNRLGDLPADGSSAPVYASDDTALADIAVVSDRSLYGLTYGGDLVSLNLDGGSLATTRIATMQADFGDALPLTLKASRSSSGPVLFAGAEGVVLGYDIASATTVRLFEKMPSVVDFVPDPVNDTIHFVTPRTGGGYVIAWGERTLDVEERPFPGTLELGRVCSSVSPGTDVTPPAETEADGGEEIIVVTVEEDTDDTGMATEIETEIETETETETETDDSPAEALVYGAIAEAATAESATDTSSADVFEEPEIDLNEAVPATDETLAQNLAGGYFMSGSSCSLAANASPDGTAAVVFPILGLLWLARRRVTEMT